jgi:insertion element IS1 protein InsB
VDGSETDGRIFLDKGCRKQFQFCYTYKGCEFENKELVLKMLCRGSGVRECAVVSGMSPSTVLSLIKSAAAGLWLKPKKRAYRRVQINEQWSYVGKKEKNVWMLYAYAVDEDEIIAFTLGKRSTTAVMNLFVKLKGLDVDLFFTDDWEAFQAVLPKTKHRIGKQYTKAIEGVNTWFRTRVRRLVRRTVCFSKKLIYHYSMLKIIIHHRNQHSSYI